MSHFIGHSKILDIVPGGNPLEMSPISQEKISWFLMPFTFHAFKLIA